MTTPNIIVELIHPIAVERDQDGWWSHPGIPDFDEDAAAWKAWKLAQRLEISHTMLEEEDDTHPAYIAYFENESASVVDWNPAPPAGPEWFTLSIHDTEDGPAFCWARRTAGEPST